jgi:Uncharacterized protein conserved in bacteria
MNNNPPGVSSKPVKDDRKVAAGKGKDFRNQLAKAEDYSYEQHLETLVDNIIRQGEKLNKKVDVRDFRDYKKLISEFLDTALGKSLKFSKKSLLDRKGRHKVYALIKKINSEVDQLARDVMSGEKENIDILRRMDDIRGLILDLLL